VNPHVCYTVHCKRTPLQVKNWDIKYVAEKNVIIFLQTPFLQKKTKLQTTAPFK